MPTVTLTGIAQTTDAFLDQGTPAGNFGATTDFYVGESNAAANIFRTVMRFDLSSIPVGSTIETATLSIYVASDISSNARTLRVYRCLRAWTEAGVTWNTYDGSNAWGTTGADNTTTDRDLTDIGSSSFTATETANTEKQFTLTAASIQSMLTGGGFTNNGFVLKMDTETNDAYSFYSSEYAVDVTKIPKLVITYALAGALFFSQI